ncbi:protein of unknown function [Cyanobium sp. NIES-981]|nr:protein of unknown function [Cyanobium sp. NIES-981]
MHIRSPRDNRRPESDPLGLRHDWHARHSPWPSARGLQPLLGCPCAWTRSTAIAVAIPLLIATKLPAQDARLRRVFDNLYHLNPLGVCRKNLVARRVLPLRDPASWSWRGDYWNDSGSL